MNRIILFSILLLPAIGMKAQVQTLVIGDSVRIRGNTGKGELILQNSTDSVKGFLYNRGAGRTEFRRGLNKVNDSLYLIGGDSLFFPKTWKQGGNIFGATGVLGTADSNHLDIYTKATRRARLTANGRFILGDSADNGNTLQVTGTSTYTGKGYFYGGVNGGSIDSTASGIYNKNSFYQQSIYKTNTIGYSYANTVGVAHRVMQNTNVYNNAWNSSNAYFETGFNSQNGYVGKDTIIISGYPFYANILSITDMLSASGSGNIKIKGGLGGYASVLNINGNPSIDKFADFVSNGTMSGIGNELDTVVNRYGLYVRDLKSDSSGRIYIGNTYPIYAPGRKDISYLGGKLIIGGGDPPVDNGRVLQVNGRMTLSASDSSGVATGGYLYRDFTTGELRVTTRPATSNGLLNYSISTASATANYSFGTNNYVVLPDLTAQANRTITLPAAPVSGQRCIIRNANNSGFAWSFTDIVKDLSGNTITALANTRAYSLVYEIDHWQIIN